MQRWLRNGLALLAIAAIAAYSFQSTPTLAGQDSVLTLQAGSEVAPVVGLSLLAEPKAFVQALAPADPTPPGAIRLERAQNVLFSADGSQHALVEFRGGKTHVELPSHQRTTLAGAYWFELDSSGQVAIAVPEAPRGRGAHELLLLDRTGLVLKTLETPEPLWISVARLGKRIAVGSASEVRIFDSDGSAIASFQGESEIGALSDAGGWLAFEQATRTGLRLVLVRTDDGAQAETGFPVEHAAAITFSPDGRWLAHVAAGALQVFTLEREPRLAFQRAPPRGSQWRDAVFSEGKLVAGRIRIDEPLREVLEEGPKQGLHGEARIGVEFLDLAGGQGQLLNTREWKVAQWSADSPELSARGARVFARVWPSAFEVLP